MIPFVAIVGRPNVGKSTLFNRLVGRRSALVADEPGLTRDRHYGRAEWEGVPFQLVDTGGFESDATPGAMDGLIREQTEVAVEEADLVLLIWDAREGITNTDTELVNLLRRSGKPTLHVANKVDGPKQDPLVAEFYATGVERIFPVSAEHGLGIDDLIDAVLEWIAAERADAGASEPSAKGDGIRIALVGRPNAGKSALLNRLAGAERSIVSDVPGTTRDPVDVEIDADGERIVVVDTAGIRRKRRSGPVMEQISVLRALRAVGEADVTCLLLDTTEPIAMQDAKIANMALEAGRGLILILSKADLLVPGRQARRELDQQLDDRLAFVSYAPQVLLSSKTGKGVNKILPMVKRVYAEGQRRISTSELNRFLESALNAHHPAAYHGRQVRLFYITQADTRPPTFIVHVNYVDGVTTSYRRYLQNRLRDQYKFEGVPLRIFYRARERSANKKPQRKDRQ
ncbi:MAG: ribosome biogenesis GTPase Der [Deltaproteobacteria bacterium]|nr:ribosome biogenesis GTPase Der [Deltaproteobacteria bacterium]